jgi:adenylate cyclase
MDRELAAILVADVVGYSALMEQDETGTFARITARRKEIFEPEIARHQGRIFKLVGDGLLAEFSSAVQAVECAIALQASLAERNRSVPEGQAIVARIGINLGEVIIDGDDRLGDGVNIAARLEQLAEPGGICVSEKVAREVERKLAFGFESMGQKRVKNIAEPIHVYRVIRDISKGPRQLSGAAKSIRQSVKWVAGATAALALAAVSYLFWPVQASRSGPPVLAVLPFVNLSGDAAQDYLGPGVSEDILTMLSTSPAVRVLSKSSSFSVAANTEPRQVAQTLNADYILEGSLRRQGETYYVSAQLVDGNDGQNVWTSRMEQSGGDLVAMQEQIASKTCATLAGISGEVVSLEQDLSWSKSAPSLEEYDYHLRGVSEFLKWTAESKYNAQKIWSEGLEKFPDSALLRIELAALYNNRAADGPTADPWQDIQLAMKLLREAEAKPDRSRMEEWILHFIKASVIVSATGGFQASVLEAEAAHALVPYDPLSSASLALVMANAGRTETAVEWAEYAVANEAVVPDWYRDNLAWAYLMAGRPEDAARTYEGLDYYCVPCKASALVRVGRLDDAKAEIDRHLAQYPGWTINDVKLFPSGRHPFLVDYLMKPYLDDLREAGLK